MGLGLCNFITIFLFSILPILTALKVDTTIKTID